jgi:hypothetical protein
MRMTLKELDYLKQCGGISARAAATIRDLAACAEAAEARVAELEREAQPDADAQKVAACKRAIEGVGWMWAEYSGEPDFAPLTIAPTNGLYEQGRDIGALGERATVALWREAAQRAVEEAARPYRERAERTGYELNLWHGVEDRYPIDVQTPLAMCFGKNGGYATTEDLEKATQWAERQAAQDAADATHIQVGHEVCPVAPDTDDDLLRVKLARLDSYLHRIDAPRDQSRACIESMVKGHEQYGEDLRTKDLTAETRQELVDALCYESQKEDPSVTVGRHIRDAYEAL